MGYSTQGSIKNFWPDDTDKEIYIVHSTSLEDLLETAKNKWPGANLSNITITPEKIHTHCLTYDLYDASDYTDFLVITYSG